LSKRKKHIIEMLFLYGRLESSVAGLPPASRRTNKNKVRTMNQSILATGSALAPSAMAFAAERPTQSCASFDELLAIIVAYKPRAVVARRAALSYELSGVTRSSSQRSRMTCAFAAGR